MLGGGNQLISLKFYFLTESIRKSKTHFPILFNLIL